VDGGIHHPALHSAAGVAHGVHVGHAGNAAIQ
jgi:hypothetical protein